MASAGYTIRRQLLSRSHWLRTSLQTANQKGSEVTFLCFDRLICEDFNSLL